ncbi:MAG: protein kinase [Legionellaceae bacterium]|nr:protein kinase [Legionellaceae bacterium]
MTKATVIVVSDRFGGYGDFLFALKLSQSLKQKYINEGVTPPPIYIVTRKEGKDQIKKLGGDVEFGTEILTPDELDRRTRSTDPNQHIDVGELIEGPVFDSDLLEQVDDAVNSKEPISLMMMSEYGAGHTVADPFALAVLYRKLRLKNIKYSQLIRTGLSDVEEGILLTESLLNPDPTKNQYRDLDESLKEVIVDSEDYRNRTELSMQYSHDTYTPNVNPTEHYLQIHREYYLDSPKNHDVIMVGKQLEMKRAALKNMVEQLKTDGFQRIVFYNTKTKTEDVLWDSQQPGRQYRGIYVEGMSHQSMLACTALSGPLMGATGDQSFGEALSANKIMVYELLAHKKGLLSSYNTTIYDAPGQTYNVKQLLVQLPRIMTDSVFECNEESRDKKQSYYQNLGELLRNTTLVSMLMKAQKDIRSKRNLTNAVFNISVTSNIAVKAGIFAFLREGHNQQALDLYNRNVGFFDKNKALIVDMDPMVLVEKIGISDCLLDCIQQKPINETFALEVMGRFQVNASLLIKNKSILQWALDNDCYLITNELIKNTQTFGDANYLGRVMQAKNGQGQSYLTQFRLAKPVKDNPETGLAGYWSTINRLSQYKPTSVFRKDIYQSFQELVKVYGDLNIDYDQDALIGLLLINMKNIKTEYRFFSPKNFLFGSKLYVICERALSDLGVNLRHLDTKQRAHYTAALSRALNQDPNLRTNNPILAKFADQADVSLPKYKPIVSTIQAQKILQPKYKKKDPYILKPSDTHFYALNKTPIGHGGWGTVYQAERHATHSPTVMPSVAVKEMETRHSDLLAKEHNLFLKVYPDGCFEQFTSGEKTYLVMPLFQGVQLDKYLRSHDDELLKRQARELMAAELLTDLANMHEKGVTHNDLKTKNILYNPVTCKMHIIDFGCARNIHEAEQLKYCNTNSSIFAFEFPPEYLIGVETNTSQDIYTMTSILAEVLGIDKRDLVQARLNRIDNKIDAELFKAIKTTFAQCDSLEDALFTSPLNRLTHTEHFQAFVTLYMNTPYDFAPYQDKLGHEVIELLNEMQSKNPKNRPTAKECVEKLKSILKRSNVKTNRVDELRGKLSQLKDNDSVSKVTDLESENYNNGENPYEP